MNLSIILALLFAFMAAQIGGSFPVVLLAAGMGWAVGTITDLKSEMKRLKLRLDGLHGAAWSDEGLVVKNQA